MSRVIPAVLFFCFIAWIVAQANRGSANIFFNVVSWLPYGDKIGHFVLYGLLAMLMNIALKHKTVRLLGRAFLLGSSSVIAFAILEELTQLFIPTRTADFIDMFCSLLGVFAFSYASKWYLQENKW